MNNTRAKAGEPVDISKAREALYRFCRGVERKSIPAQRDDDDLLIADALNELEKVRETIRDRDKTIAELQNEIERLSQLTLHELIADSNGINMKVGGASGKAFMAALIKFFEDNGGKNFLAMTLEKDEFKYQIEIRNLHGELSAAEKLDVIEKQNALMLSALERIRANEFSTWTLGGFIRDTIGQIKGGDS